MAAQTGSTYFSGTMIDSSRDISISGLGGHIAISGCRLLLLSFGDTSLTSLLLLELQQYLFWICFVVLVNMTIKFRQFKKSHVFDVMPNNFWCTDWRHDCCIVPTPYSGKVTKGQRPMLNRNFLLIQKLSWGLFLLRSTIRGLSRRFAAFTVSAL